MHEAVGGMQCGATSDEGRCPRMWAMVRTSFTGRSGHMLTGASGQGQIDGRRPRPRGQTAFSATRTRRKPETPIMQTCAPEALREAR
eukprot:13799339-Alexandrium_andersonii.AAC.1